MKAEPRITLLGIFLILAMSRVAYAGTANVNLAASGAVLSGYWAQATADGRAYVGGGNGSQLDASVRGASIVLTCYSTAKSTITVTVDGVISTPVFSTTNAWTNLEIALGAEGVHSLSIKQPYLRSSFFLDTGAGAAGGPTFSINGQAPAISPPAPAFGPQYQLSDPVGVAPYVQAEGGLEQMDTDGYPSVYHSPPDFTDEALYFTASASGPIQGWIYGGGEALCLYVDNVKAGVVTVPQTNTYQWVTLFAGDGSPHRYGLTQVYNGSEGLSIWSLMTVGGTLSAIATPARPRFIAYGDSITQAQVGVHDDSSLAYAQRTGVELGWAVYNRGIAATSVRGFATANALFSTEAGENRTGDVTSVADGANGVVILYGTNDMAQKGGGESIADFQASYQHMLTDIVAGVPAACPIVCVGILPRTDFTPATINSWNAAVRMAAAATASPNVIYADPSDWGLLQNNGSSANYTDANHNTLDGLHPNGDGYTIMVKNLVPYFASPGFPIITSARSAAGQTGKTFAYQITVSAASTNFNADGLPAGLTIDPVTGLISGTPAQTGQYTATLSSTNASGTDTAALDLTVTDGIPSVAVSTAGNGAAEAGGANGKVIVSRTGEATGSLTVNYKVKGSAQAGLDYKTLPGVVTFPAGVEETVIKIKAISGPAHADERAAKIKLLPASDGNYNLGDSTVATVKIIVNK